MPDPINPISYALGTLAVVVPQMAYYEPARLTQLARIIHAQAPSILPPPRHDADAADIRSWLHNAQSLLERAA